ncbi:MAG: HAD family hydrolase [Candidatus Thorarchaeota archaeon]
MGNFKVIFFNAGGTLIQMKDITMPILYSKILSRILEKSISSEEVFKAFKKADSWALSRRKPGALFTDLDQRKYQNVFYSQLGVYGRKEINRIESKVADLLELDNYFVLEKGAKELLESLKPRYELGLISNWDESLTDILQNLGILSYFDSITISVDIGVSKPDIEIFRSALEDFPDVRPKESVYIGDDYVTDIIPALQMNMFAIFFDKGPSGMHGRPFQTEAKSIRINELSELPKILNEYSKKL